jgi:DNA-binding CsgD family transcriptional regulator
LHPPEGEPSAQTGVYFDEESDAMAKGHPWTSEEEKKLSRLRANGLTCRAAAKELGRSEAAVVTHLTIMKSRSKRKRNKAPVRRRSSANE